MTVPVATEPSYEATVESEDMMRIDIRRKSARRDLSARALQGHFERRLRFALGRFGERISFVRLFLEDLNGPRGGIDLECRAVARVRGLGNIVVELRDCRMATLMDRVAERLSNSIARRLERRRFRQPRAALNGGPSDS